VRKLVALALAVMLMVFLTACGAAANTLGAVQSADTAAMPASSSHLKGEDYQDVVSKLRSAGFTNVITATIDDLVTGWLTKDGEVEKVSVDGSTDFQANSKFPKGAEIVVTYHTFPKEATDSAKETSSTAVDNPKSATTTTSEDTTTTVSITTTSSPSTTATLGGSPLEITKVIYDAPGNDNDNLNEEYVVFKVLVSINLVGYAVEDDGADHRYDFPDRAFQEGQTFTLHTGEGTDTQTDLYWGQTGTAVWNNGGDTVNVISPQGETVESHEYPGN
jgi:hypothetical protein